MATASIVLPEPVTPPPATVNLVLSLEEAKTLLTVVSHIGGDQHTSLRKHTDSIYVALATLNAVTTHNDNVFIEGYRSIFFKDGTFKG